MNGENNDTDRTKPDMSTRGYEPVGVDWRPAFISALSIMGNVGRACKAANIGRSTVYEAKVADKEFAAQWDIAIEEATDTLEEEAWRRAHDGVTRKQFTRNGDPIMDRETGEQYVLHEYSDTLMVTLLKAHRPQKYRENVRTELTGAGGGPITVNDGLTDTERTARVMGILDAARARRVGQASGNDEASDMGSAGGAAEAGV